MAITITVAELAESIRVGSTARETNEVTRLRDYAIIAISRNLGDTYEDAPEEVVNLAASLMVGYLYDKPTVSSGVGLSNSMKFSGAGNALFPYRIHHVGLIGGDMVAAAQAAVGTEGNPVTDVAIMGAELVVTFADGTEERHDLPAVGVDNAAVQALIDAHAAMPSIHHIPPVAGLAGDVIVDLPGGRLPANNVEMRIGWSQTVDFVEANYVRADNHPADGASVGTTAGLLVPPFPPALAGDDTLYLGIWISYVGNVPIQQFPGDPITFFGSEYFSAPVPLTVDGATGQSYTLIATRIDAATYADHGSEFFVMLPGELVATRTWVTARIANIMLSGGGITTAQAQALIDAAIGDFQTAAEVQTVVAAAIAALPEYQTLAQVSALITAYRRNRRLDVRPDCRAGSGVDYPTRGNAKHSPYTRNRQHRSGRDNRPVAIRVPNANAGRVDLLRGGIVGRRG